MSYHIDVKPEARLVQVTHSGHVDLSEMESSRAQAVAMLTHHGFSRLLVDTRDITRRPTVTEHHRFASSQPLYMPPHIAVAVVLSADEYTAPRPFEELSVDRGVLLRAFGELEEAQTWLGRITN